MNVKVGEWLGLTKGERLAVLEYAAFETLKKRKTPAMPGECA